MELYMKEASLMINMKDLENYYLKMGVNMKEILVII